MPGGAREPQLREVLHGAWVQREEAVVSGGNFIRAAIKRPGQLHRDLGVPEGQSIPRTELLAAAKQPGKVGERARLALTLEGLRRPKPGGSLAKAAGGGSR